LKTSDPPRRNTYSCTAPRLSWPPRLRFWRSPPHRLLRRHLVSSPAPTRWDRPAVNDPAMLRSTPHLAHCLGFCRPPSTPGGVLSDTAHGSRNTDLTRSGRHSAITRNTAGFSLDPPFCGLRNFLSLRTFGAPPGRRQHVHPGIPMPRTRVARPHTRRRATRRSPLR